MAAVFFVVIQFQNNVNKTTKTPGHKPACRQTGISPGILCVTSCLSVLVVQILNYTTTVFFCVLFLT